MLQQMVSRFSNDFIKPKVREMDDKCRLDSVLLNELFENGLMGIEIPIEYGGSGMNFVSSCLAIEEIAKIDPSVAVMVDVQNTLLNNLLGFWGNEKQKSKYFPQLACNKVASFCLSENSAGSDAFSLTTSAKLSEDKSFYTINGEKMWISNAEQAEIFFVFANVDKSLGYKGITCFIVEKELESGIVIGPKEEKLGIRASSTCPVSFVDCKVPVENVLGEIGQGYKYAIDILNEGRIGIGAQMVGLSTGCLEHVMPYLFERVQFGKKIGDFQAVEHQYAQMATEIEAARSLIYHAARLKESGKPFIKEAAMGKLFSSQVANKTASLCVELLGGVGYTKAFLAEKYYRDCKIGAIYEGTSNIQLNTIAKMVKSQFI
eukprot:CAMPEP_0171473694 /NCGR_PEP_ID=MMETSP0946-20130122/1987_1 /TAXON_ID=109269 /ORGANISM="Vaucheria litorea, Strain CCMP2940" /LENGTH=374 /DNA_ID=CAMNT_0012003493 /DNA_START=183 /DNA_END=1307 /DNA_ORIENTATION=-